jgi:hypothetical protein
VDLPGLRARRHRLQPQDQQREDMIRRVGGVSLAVAEGDLGLRVLHTYTLCHRAVSQWIMADSDAVRSRRKRLHAAGDHSICGRCGGRRAVVAVPAAGGAPVDPDAALEALARRLEAAHEADPGDAQVARVLKDTLLALRAGEAKPDAELAALLDAVRA